MDKSNKKTKLLVNVGFIVLSVLLITYFLPETELQIPECLRSYTVDAKWAYDDYKAPFDVDHYSDTAAAVAKVKEEFVPTYERYDEASHINRLATLEEITKAHPEVPAGVRMAITSTVKQCLERGIIDDNTIKLKYIIEADQKVPTANMFTTDKVLKKLVALCPPNSNAQVIVNKIADEELLAPNLAKNEAQSAQALNAAIESARLPDGIVSKGTVIVR